MEELFTVYLRDDGKAEVKAHKEIADILGYDDFKRINNALWEISDTCTAAIVRNKK